MRDRTLSGISYHFICRHYFKVALILFILILFYPLAVNYGSFTYQMDDTYIHMAMAKNLAEHGVWSINGEGFISASSSLLYTVLLAALFSALGPGLYMYIPLALNLILALALLFVVDRMMEVANRKPVVRFLVLLLIIIAAPLGAITFMGMEHVLHLLLSLLALHFIIRTLGTDGKRQDAMALVFLMPFLCTVRYEGLFFLPPFLVILAVRRRASLAAAVLIASLLPLTIFSAYSVSRGSFVLPNPIIIKGVVKARDTLIDKASPSAHGVRGETSEPPVGSGFSGPVKAGRMAVKLIWRFISKAWVFAILVLSSVFFWIGMRRDKDIWRPSSIYYLIFVSVVATHVILAGIGRQYRYEVYLMGMGFVLMGLSFPRFRDMRDLARSAAAGKLLILTGLLVFPLVLGLRSDYDYWKLGLRDYLISSAMVSAFVLLFLLRRRLSGEMLRARLALAAVMVVFLVPIVARGMTKQVQVPSAMRNIFEQQYQMGKFVNRHYRGRTVAVNDIGAVAYFGDATILDLWGLGDDEVLQARMRGKYDTDFIEGLLRQRGVTLVIVYDGWFKRFGGLPEMLLKAGMWEVGNNVVLGGDRVSFYATDEAGLDELRGKLREYERSLPPAVKVYYQ